MKKILGLIFAIALLTSCASTRVSPIDQLTIGMSKRDVQYTIGPPDRLIEAHYVNGEYLEVLQYTVYGDVYALEFWNDYLTSSEYLYADRGYYYAPPAYPPSYYGDRGRPIIIINRPPNYRPGQNTRPPNSGRPEGNTRPPGSGRPENNTRPPSSGRPESGRPSENTRPSNPNSGRGESSSSGRGESTNNAGRGSSTRESTRGSSSSSESSRGSSSTSRSSSSSSRSESSGSSSRSSSSSSDSGRSSGSGRR